jgi:hypothetical protein
MQSALTFGLGMLLATALIADEGLAEAPGRQLLTFLPGKPLTICAAENLTNRPIPDVHFSVDGNSRRVDWRRDGQECISIPGLPAGETLIEVSAPGFRSEWVRIERRHDTYDSWTGEPVGIGLFALETGVVQGRVVDAMTGQPIPRATAQLKESIFLTATSDERGEFQIDGIPPGEYELTVEHHSYQTSAPEHVELRGEDQTYRNISLTPDSNYAP